MRAESDWVRAVAVGRIQDKTRWTKALGEAVTVVYGIVRRNLGKADIPAGSVKSTPGRRRRNDWLRADRETQQGIDQQDVK